MKIGGAVLELVSTCPGKAVPENFKLIKFEVCLAQLDCTVQVGHTAWDGALGCFLLTVHNKCGS